MVAVATAVAVAVVVVAVVAGAGGGGGWVDGEDTGQSSHSSSAAEPLVRWVLQDSTA